MDISNPQNHTKGKMTIQKKLIVSFDELRKLVERDAGVKLVMHATDLTVSFDGNGKEFLTWPIIETEVTQTAQP
jgi:hypothetical protein